jgi:hypothetical protein
VEFQIVFYELVKGFYSGKVEFQIVFYELVNG